MANPTRTIHLPEPGDLRTCTRWACLQRIPGTGPDPTVLTNQVQRAVATVAATVIATAEADGNLQATDQYIHAFLQHFWAGIEALPGPRYPLPLLAVAEERGTRCIETLVERVLPRLQYREQLLTHMLPFEWQIPDGTGGELLFPGVIARLGEDRLTGAIRIYDWQVEESHFPTMNAGLRYQRIGVALGWLQNQYPGRETAYVEVFLLRDITWESIRTPQELCLLEELLRKQADEVQHPLPFGHPPLHLLGN
ncbi:MAG: hypothetical protein C3F12_04385 [Candidatus Methylomirabilota bacterium]|nr:hypothetical protein [candidate division NC10 bacterium]PWB47221.1 MAG: hypothetical protein C3F12_04385 [candidate division NC10 bacterium]